MRRSPIKGAARGREQSLPILRGHEPVRQRILSSVRPQRRSVAIMAWVHRSLSPRLYMCAHPHWRAR